MSYYCSADADWDFARYDRDNERAEAAYESDLALFKSEFMANSLTGDQSRLVNLIDAIDWRHPERPGDERMYEDMAATLVAEARAGNPVAMAQLDLLAETYAKMKIDGDWRVGFK